MRKIWKYELPPMGAFTLSMQAGAKPLAVGFQPGPGTLPALVLWAEVDVDANLESRVVFVVTTGGELPPADANAVYVGTAGIDGPGGQYVVHVYVEE